MGRARFPHSVTTSSPLAHLIVVVVHVAMVLRFTCEQRSVLIAFIEMVAVESVGNVDRCVLITRFATMTTWL